MTPTDKAAIEGLIELGNRMRAVDKAAAAAWNQPTDTEHDRLSLEADKLFEEFAHASEAALPALQRLLAEETREVDACPVDGDWRISDWSICLGTIRVARVDFDTMPDPTTPERIKLLEWMQRRLNLSPFPMTAAGAVIERLNKLANSLDSPKASCDGKWIAEKIREALHG